MAINSKIVYIKKKETFESLLSTIPAGLNPIVFIEDSRELWTCGTFFSIGYPELVIGESGGSVIVTLGDSNFSISTTGSGVSVRKGTGNSIIFNGTALTKVDTAAPLEWTNNKLLHQVSGATPGIYGPTSDLTKVNTFNIPEVTVNDTGHITDIDSRSVTIRDYVEQVSPSLDSKDRNILLGYNAANDEDEVAITQKANGLTYNNSTQKLTVGGGINANGGVTVNSGDLQVVGGYIVGNLKGDVTGVAVPKIHLSDKPEYGGASKTLYGHVTLQDTIPTTAPNDSSDNTNITNTGVVAVAASPKMVWNLKQYVDEHGIKVSGSDSAGNTKDISTGFSFGGDFVIDSNNNIDIGWKEITN